MRTLMHSHVHGEAPLSFSTPYIDTVGFRGDPSDLLCTNRSNWSYQNRFIPSQSSSTDEWRSSRPCHFHIPTSLTAYLKSQKSEVVQVLFGVDAELGYNPLLTAADPPISTSLVAMELTTPQGKPIQIRDLDPEQAIQVTLPNKYPVGQGDGGGDGRGGEAGNETCLTVPLPSEGRLNLTVKAVDGLDENAGLYISFNFSLDPGTVDIYLSLDLFCFLFFIFLQIFLFGMLLMTMALMAFCFFFLAMRLFTVPASDGYKARPYLFKALKKVCVALTLVIISSFK